MSAGVLRVDVCTCFEKHVNHRRIGLSGVHGLHENSTAVFIRRVHISSGFRQFENSFDIAIVDNILQHIRDVLFVNLAGVGPGFRQRDKSCEVGPVRRDVQRRLPLRADSVDLRSSVNEDVDDLSRGVLIARGGHQNRSALLVLDLRVGPGAEKHFEDIRVCVVPRGCHQRRQALLLRRRIHIGPCLYQQYGNLRIFTHRGSHHGGNVVLAPGVDVRPSSEQRGDDLGVLVRSCGHERRLAVLAHGVHVRPGVLYAAAIIRGVSSCLSLASMFAPSFSAAAISSALPFRQSFRKSASLIAPKAGTANKTTNRAHKNFFMIYSLLKK